MKHVSRKARVRRIAVMLVGLLVVAWVATGAWHVYKPLPDGVGAAGPVRPAGQVEFLADLSYRTPDGERATDQRIFDAALEMIAGARRLVVMDMFLINDFAGASDADTRPLAEQFTRALIAGRRTHPDLDAVLITDPFNTFYGGLESEYFRRMEEAGVEVIVTDLDRLRDSNPAWSGLWRICCRWLGTSSDGGWLPNPVGPGEVGLRNYMRLLNFKANHRKVLVTDAGDGLDALVTSGNTHDASSNHGNVALKFSGPAARDMLVSEAAVAAFSGTSFPPLPAMPETAETALARVQVLTEGAIRDALVGLLDRAGPGDAVDMAVFYLSHRGVIRALKRAHARGAEVRVLLDPNRDAFGKEKNGIPNRPVAAELVDAGIDVRWCNTSGEQCHSKFLLLRPAAGEAELILGSANFTRRNLDDLNLETSVRVLAPPDAAVIADAARYFARRWHNEPGREFSLPYPAFTDESWWSYWRYRFMEATGMSTF